VLFCISPAIETRAGSDGRYELIIRAPQAQVCADVSLVVIAAGYQPFVGVFSVIDLRNQPHRDFGLLPSAVTTPPRLIYMPLILKISIQPSLRGAESSTQDREDAGSDEAIWCTTEEIASLATCCTEG